MEIGDIKYRDESSRMYEHKQYGARFTTDDGHEFFASLITVARLPKGTGDEFSDYTECMIFRCLKGKRVSDAVYRERGMEFNQQSLIDCINDFISRGDFEEKDEPYYYGDEAEPMLESRVRKLVAECTMTVLRELGLK